MDRLEGLVNCWKNAPGKGTFLPLFLCLLVLACGRGRMKIGLSLETLAHAELERSYYLHLPADYEAGTEPLPLMLVLHGGGENNDGDEMARWSDYNRLADREGFIAVYPNGIKGSWNDGRTDPKIESEVDDAGFLAALIDHLLAEYRADPDRVYVTGASNGGMMSLRLGCAIAPRLAAIAPVIANMPADIVEACQPEQPLPILLMNGTADPLVPWDGGHVTVFGQERGAILSTEETIRFWADHNQCDPEPEISRLSDLDPEDGSSVRIERYTGCRATVILYAIEGGGHTLPGSEAPNLKFLLGNKNNDIVGSERIWDFFEQTGAP